MGKYDKQLQKVVKEGRGNFVAVDGSILAFRAAAAGELKTIKATYKPSGKTKAFKHRTEFKNYIKEKNAENALKESNGEPNRGQYDLADFEIEDVTDSPPLKVSIKNTESMIAYILEMCEAEEYAIFLDEGETFRHELATVQRYKGQRKNEKPANFKSVQRHLISAHGAKVVKEIEADDVLNFYQYEGHKLTKSGSKRKIIAATIDKDAFGNGGWIYDFRKDDGMAKMLEPEFVDGMGYLVFTKAGCKGSGHKFFYYQWLCGDAVDNYKPCKLSGKRFGHKSAFDLLNDLETEEELYNAVVNKYKEWYPEPVTYLRHEEEGAEMITKDYKQLLQEYFDLVRMRRFEDDELSYVDYYKVEK